MSERERMLAEQLRFGPELRLACQTTTDADIKVRRLVIDEDDLYSVWTRRGDHFRSARKGILRSCSQIFVVHGVFGETPPYDVIYVLNRYFYHMGKIISSDAGSIDNYIGDGLMALFGFDDRPRACLRAVKAGFAND